MHSQNQNVPPASPSTSRRDSLLDPHFKNHSLFRVNLSFMLVKCSNCKKIARENKEIFKWDTNSKYKNKMIDLFTDLEPLITACLARLKEDNQFRPGPDADMFYGFLRAQMREIIHMTDEIKEFVEKTRNMIHEHNRKNPMKAFLGYSNICRIWKTNILTIKESAKECEQHLTATPRPIRPITPSDSKITVEIHARPSTPIKEHVGKYDSILTNFRMISERIENSLKKLKKKNNFFAFEEHKLDFFMLTKDHFEALETAINAYIESMENNEKSLLGADTKGFYERLKADIATLGQMATNTLDHIEKKSAGIQFRGFLTFRAIWESDLASIINLCSESMIKSEEDSNLGLLDMTAATPIKSPRHSEPPVFTLEGPQILTPKRASSHRGSPSLSPEDPQVHRSMILRQAKGSLLPTLAPIQSVQEFIIKHWNDILKNKRACSNEWGKHQDRFTGKKEQPYYVQIRDLLANLDENLYEYLPENMEEITGSPTLSERNIYLDSLLKKIFDFATTIRHIYSVAERAKEELPDPDTFLDECTGPFVILKKMNMSVNSCQDYLLAELDKLRTYEAIFPDDQASKKDYRMSSIIEEDLSILDELDENEPVSDEQVEISEPINEEFAIAKDSPNRSKKSLHQSLTQEQILEEDLANVQESISSDLESVIHSSPIRAPALQ